MTTFEEKTFKRTVGKKQTTLVTNIFPFTTMFSIKSKTNWIVWATIKLSPANAFKMVYSICLLFGKELNSFLWDKIQFLRRIKVMKTKICDWFTPYQCYRISLNDMEFKVQLSLLLKLSALFSKKEDLVLTETQTDHTSMQMWHTLPASTANNVTILQCPHRSKLTSNHAFLKGSRPKWAIYGYIQCLH